MDPIDSTSDLFHQCWRIQDCGNCLHSAHPCSWCPTVCVLLCPCYHPFCFHIFYRPNVRCPPSYRFPTPSNLQNLFTASTATISSPPNCVVPLIAFSTRAPSPPLSLRHIPPTNPPPAPVLHLRPQPHPALPLPRPDPHAPHNPPHLSPRRRALRAARETARLPRQHHHVADVHHHRALHICGDWAGVGGREGCSGCGEGRECVGEVGTEEVAEAGVRVVAVVAGGRGMGGLETRGGGEVAAEVEGGFGGYRCWGEGERRGEGEAAWVGWGKWLRMWRAVSRVSNSLRGCTSSILLHG